MWQPPIYYGFREAEHYYEHKTTDDHVMICVSLSFLQFVNQQTKKIYVVDRSPLQVVFNRLVVDLIKQSKDIYDFLSFVSSRTVTEQKLCRESLGEKVDRSLETANPKFYEATLARDSVQNRINLFSFKVIENNMYYWHFGYMSLKDNDTFLELQRCLRNVEIEYICRSLEELDYGELQGEKTYVFASNADTVCYTKSDQIYQSICDTIKPETTIHYRSWYRSIEINGNLHHYDASLKIRPLVLEKEVIELQTYQACHFVDEELQTKITRMTLGEYLHFEGYSPRDVLFYHMCLESFDEKLVDEFLAKACMAHFRIIIMDRAETLQVWMEAFLRQRLNYSYRMSLDWSGGRSGYDRNFIMVLDLRGVSP